MSWSDFHPLPLLSNPHLQTVLGNLLPGPSVPLTTAVHHVSLPDGDRLALHDTAPGHWQTGGPIAVLVHGLGGTHHSAYLLRLARLLLPHGWRIVRLDLRGSGAGLPLARLPYHAGCSDDLRAVVAMIHRWSPTSPVALVGFSLGGNIVLKLAGEAADRPVPGLARVAAVGPPIDLMACADLIEQPHNRFYERRFLRDLLDLARRRRRFFPDLPRIRFPQPLSLKIYDDRYTARLWGFDGYRDYYRRSSSLRFIPNIQVPALILTARDDPFIAVEPFEALRVPQHIEVRILERGGHLGFLGWDGVGGVRWAERRVAEWLSA